MSKKIINDPASDAGSVRITSMAREALNRQDVKTALDKHSACNWGDVGANEWMQNDEAYKSGGKIVSRHISKNGKAFLLITEADRSETTVFLPDDGSMKRAC